MLDFDKTFENEVGSSKDKEIYKLKKNMAIKEEEVQALYLEVKQQRSLAEKYEIENKHLKQQIKQLEKEAEEMLLYP
jgi:isopropylmalate/homocitrate/citramalate synthase